MPDYRIYGPDGKGGIVEQPPEELAGFLGVSQFDANLLLRGMNLVKTICAAVGRLESPPLVWNQNMPEPLVKFVTDHVAEKLQANPGWQLKDFDWALLYEEDGITLKYC